jgi:hypothetical protein
MTEPDRERLGQAIAARRKALGLSLSAAAKIAGIDRGTWTATERATRQTEEYTYAGIERALQWVTGSVERILAGGEPGIHHSRTVHDSAGATDSVSATVYPATVRGTVSIPQPTVIVREDFDLDLQVRKVRALTTTDVRTKQALIEALIDLARDMEIDRARQADGEVDDVVVHANGQTSAYQIKAPAREPQEPAS